MKTKNKSWGGFEKFKPVDSLAELLLLTKAQQKLARGAKLSQREVCALAREASRGNDVIKSNP